MSKKTKKSKKKVESGKTVNLHYVGTLDDGTEFDSTRAREETLSVEVGSGQLIPGFDTALPGMKIGDVKTVQVFPGEAYGEVNPEAFQTMPQSVFPTGFDFQVDSIVQGKNQEGNPVRARVESVGKDTVTLDFNHPLAGKNLNFEIEVVSID